MEIAEFQNLMHDLYAHNDRRRGATATMLWLVEEVGELAEAVAGMMSIISKRRLQTVLHGLVRLPIFMISILKRRFLPSIPICVRRVRRSLVFVRIEMGCFETKRKTTQHNDTP